MLQVENVSGGYGKDLVVKSVTFQCEKRRSTRHIRSKWQRKIDVVESHFGYSYQRKRNGHD